MWIHAAVTSFLLLTSAAGIQGQCTPGDNCKLPNCRCWDDPKPPGGFNTAQIPQMVLVSFEYAVNSGNVDRYQELFSGITNPNGCPPRATLFVQKTNTDFNIVKRLYDDKYEIGMTSTTGTVPQTAQDWKDSFAEMRAQINRAGIPSSNIMGCRGPELLVGGNEQFDSIEANGLTYDSTCVSFEYVSKDNLIWPYTYDFIDTTPPCTIGKTPTKKYPGKWQFLVADLEFKGQKCASPSGCSPLIEDSQDAFDLLYDAFVKHYEETTRAPFILYLDPMWLTVDYQEEGTRQFLQFVRAAFDDTWIITNQQALAWLQSPVPNTNTTTFKPWDC